MYPLNTLMGYGNALPNGTDKDKFLTMLRGLQRETYQGVYMITGGALTVGLHDNGLAHLDADIAARWVSFTDKSDVTGDYRN